MGHLRNGRIHHGAIARMKCTHMIYLSIFIKGEVLKWCPCVGCGVEFIENNVCTRVTNRFSAHERVILVFISRVAKQRGNEYQKKTRVSPETVRQNSTYIILFLTRHNESINDYKNDELYTSSPCLTRLVFVLLMTSQSIADDVTMARQLWCDHVNNDI